jgi:hypothetical protein
MVAGFGHVATMLVQQGIMDPLGEQHLASTLINFFESRVVRLLELACLESSATLPSHAMLITDYQGQVPPTGNDWHGLHH